MDNVQFACYHADVALFVNSLTISSDGKHYVPVLNSLSASCTKCTKKPFPVGNGSVNQQTILTHQEIQGEFTQTEIQLKGPCQPCPFGGVCLDDYVKALPNYWGNKYNELIVFQACPPHYCYNSIDVPCD